MILEFEISVSYAKMLSGDGVCIETECRSELADRPVCSVNCSNINSATCSVIISSVFRIDRPDVHIILYEREGTRMNFISREIELHMGFGRICIICGYSQKIRYEYS